MIEMRRANEVSLHYPEEKRRQENMRLVAVGKFRGEAYMLRMFGAQERTRTSTTLRPLAPEASASASSATWAQVRILRGNFHSEVLGIFCQRSGAHRARPGAALTSPTSPSPTGIPFPECYTAPKNSLACRRGQAWRTGSNRRSYGIHGICAARADAVSSDR